MRTDFGLEHEKRIQDNRSKDNIIYTFNLSLGSSKYARIPAATPSLMKRMKYNQLDMSIHKYNQHENKTLIIILILLVTLKFNRRHICFSKCNYA